MSASRERILQLIESLKKKQRDIQNLIDQKEKEIINFFNSLKERDALYHAQACGGDKSSSVIPKEWQRSKSDVDSTSPQASLHRQCIPVDLASLEQATDELSPIKVVTSSPNSRTRSPYLEERHFVLERLSENSSSVLKVLSANDLPLRASTLIGNKSHAGQFAGLSNAQVNTHGNNLKSEYGGEICKRVRFKSNFNENDEGIINSTKNDHYHVYSCSFKRSPCIKESTASTNAHAISSRQADHLAPIRECREVEKGVQRVWNNIKACREVIHSSGVSSPKRLFQKSSTVNQKGDSTELIKNKINKQTELSPTEGRNQTDISSIASMSSSKERSSSPNFLFHRKTLPSFCVKFRNANLKKPYKVALRSKKESVRGRKAIVLKRAFSRSESNSFPSSCSSCRSSDKNLRDRVKFALPFFSGALENQETTGSLSGIVIPSGKTLFFE